MSSSTPNIALTLPVGGEHVSRQIINDNNTKIDTYAGKVNTGLDGLRDGIAIVADGNTHAAITSGQFVYVKNHQTLSEGLYTASTNIAANAALSGSNLTADPKGGLNALSEQIGNYITVVNSIKDKTSSSTNFEYTGNSVTIPANSFFSLEGYGAFTNGQPLGALFSLSQTETNPYQVIAKSADGCCRCTISGYTSSALTLYLWCKWSPASNNQAIINGYYRTLS